MFSARQKHSCVRDVQDTTRLVKTILLQADRPFDHEFPNGIFQTSQFRIVIRGFGIIPPTISSLEITLPQNIVSGIEKPTFIP